MAIKTSATPTVDAVNGPANTRSNKKGPIEKLTGFHHAYNALLWFIFGGALLGFCLSRLPMLDVQGFYRREGGIGEYFYIKQDLYKSGFILHLIGILFANLLAVFQFVPIIRHKAVIVHILNGYAVFLLFALGAAGGIIITPHAYGGHIETQTAAGALAILVLVAFSIAYLQIKRHQVDQHRKWMLRAINMMASIVTSRIILHIATAIMADIGTYYEIWQCDQLQFTISDNARFATAYPECGNGSLFTTVLANNNNVENKASCARLVFGMSLWLAVSVHIILMEFYIHFTPLENERLRQISYKRQLARGFKNPGSSGITAELFSTMKWVPPTLQDA